MIQLNSLRNLHRDTLPLLWSSRLAWEARLFADQIADDKMKDVETEAKEKKWGVNIYVVEEKRKRSVSCGEALLKW